ncbi:hypothetical protein GALL_188340 [mine drainage metagenome]|uniref:Uncharacterized protein n=1 Tax=mine drainage metagenome TaxID=410659 RepID=A0A1J5RTT4_9ZZZZ
MGSEKHVGYLVNGNALPDKFPTNRHEPAFWEALGRAVATFGFLEDTLSRAIFAVTATTHYQEEEFEEAYKRWFPTLERALVDPLGNLIDVYGKAVRNNSGVMGENFDDLLKDLRDASKIRNVICHCSWGTPDSKGATVPSFVNKQKEVFSTPVDTPFLDQLQRSTRDIACAVINTVTHMGWQFPGSTGPGEVIWNNQK